jgi:hypothetical protein
MEPAPVITCPQCGMQVSQGTKHCPICQARIQPIGAGRLIAWGVIVALALVVALLWAIFARH